MGSWKRTAQTFPRERNRKMEDGEEMGKKKEMKKILCWFGSRRE